MLVVSLLGTLDLSRGGGGGLVVYTNYGGVLVF